MNVMAAAHDNAKENSDRSVKVAELLMDAIVRSAGKAAQVLLKNYNEDASILSSARMTCLHVAARQGQRELCTLLLDAGASLHMVDEKGNTPLHYALVGNQPKITDLLISRGAAIDAVNNAGRSALHQAALYGHRELCTVLLDAGVSLHLNDKGGNTPLHCAALNNQPKITDLLISRGATIDAVNNAGRSALHVAAKEGHRELCILLLDAGASLHMVDEKGNTPLHYTIFGNQSKLTDLLIFRGAAIDAVNNAGRSALHMAAYNCSRQLCTLLLDAGASLHLIDKGGNTPLHCAASNNQPEVMDLLLSRRAVVNEVDNNRRTALHIAINKQHVQCVKVLLRYHCDVQLQDMYGYTALHYAIKNNALDVIDALCIERVDLTLNDKKGFNMLHYAAFVGNVYAIKRLVTQVPHLVDVKMEDGNAALHLAALKGHREVASMLLSQNGGLAEVNLRNNLGQTPLHLATSEGHLSLVELLVHHNADVGNIDVNGNTVLHIACDLAKNKSQKIVSIPESIRDLPLIHAICQKLARQGAQTELVLACFLISVDRSCKLLMQVRNNKYKTPFDLLECKQQAALFAYFLETENNPSTSYVKPPPYRMDNISQSEELPTKKRKVVSGDTIDAAEYRDYSGIIADTQQENRIDPSSSTTLVCDHIVVKTQMIQDGQLETGEASKANPDKSKDVSSEDKQKKKVSIREKEKDKGLEPLPLQMFRYLQTKITKTDKMQNICNICLERRCNIAFLCGHCACKECAAQLSTCHMCRKTIQKKINLY